MRIFSGIRPSSDQLHIGNYLGAIKQWIDLQEDNDAFFCVVDLHAVTTPYDPSDMPGNVQSAALTYLAAGLDPQKCTLFVQSHVAAHTQLSWLLSVVTPAGDLERMTQYKEKAKKHKHHVNAGLLTYPILMAADILMYKTEQVPVGKDQVQHVELARELARRFNKKFGDTFPEPKVKLSKEGAKIMSLQDPSSKMSKSDNESSYIGLFDTEEDIRKKISRAVTDTGKGVRFDEKKKPGISNLLTIHSLLSGTPIPELEKQFTDTGYADFKNVVADVVVEQLAPFRNKKEKLNEAELNTILQQGAQKAETAANETLAEVMQRMGLR